MDWHKMSAREAGKAAERAIKYMEATGVVREGYYRIHDNHYPVIYAQLSTWSLDGVHIVIRDDGIADILEKMEQVPDPYNVYDTPAGCRCCGAVISRGEQHSRSCENAD